MAFIGWFEGEEMVANSMSQSWWFTAEQNKTVQARFAPGVFVSVSSSPPNRGRAFVSGAALTETNTTTSGWVAMGTQLLLIAANWYQNPPNPQDRWAFDGWFENGVRVSTEEFWNITVFGPRNLQARFVSHPGNEVSIGAAPYSVGNNNPFIGGAVTGGGTGALGRLVTLRATPSSGWFFAGWYDHSAGQQTQLSTANPWGFTATRNMSSIRAHFTTVPPTPPPQGPHTITAAAATGGTVIMVGGAGNNDGITQGAFRQGTFNHHTLVRLIAVPEAGRTFDGWFEGNTRVFELEDWNFGAARSMNVQARFSGGTPSPPGEITITYMNGDVVVRTQTVPAGDVVIAGPREMSREFELFYGWISGSGTVFLEGQTTGEFSSNVVLDAVWMRFEGGDSEGDG